MQQHERMGPGRGRAGLFLYSVCPDGGCDENVVTEAHRTSAAFKRGNVGEFLWALS